MEYKFPLLGFPRESNKGWGGVIYQCWFSNARIALWTHNQTNFALNIYHARFTDDVMTHKEDRFEPTQDAIVVRDAFEAMAMIIYLVQKYLPTEVTNDERCTGQAGSCTSAAGAA